MTGSDQRTARALLRAAAKGNRQAWDELVDRYAGSMWTVMKDFDLPEDDLGHVGEAVWIRFLERIELFVKRPEEIDRWVATITRQECARRVDGITERMVREVFRDERRLLRDADPVLRHRAVSPQRLTDLAAFLAGSRRSSLHDEWRSHLSGDTGRGLARGDQIRAARGFLWAAVRLRLQDAAASVWRPVDAVLGSRTLSNLFVWVPVTVMLVAIVHHDGRFGLVADDQDPVALGAFLYGVIRTGRWWRGIKPPEPKARRARE